MKVARLRRFIENNIALHPTDPASKLALQRFCINKAKHLAKESYLYSDKPRTLLLDGLKLDDENMLIHREVLRSVVKVYRKNTDKASQHGYGGSTDFMVMILNLAPILAEIADQKFFEKPAEADWGKL